MLALAASCLSAILLLPLDAPPGIDPAAAARAFAEARSAATADGGRLWGVSLDRPLLVVDRASREVIASRADAEGALRRAEGGVFAGTLPPSVTIANTSVDWLGVRWAMVIWPLPDDARERVRLLLHESFHAAQGEIGLPAANPANAHLDALHGRLFLQLEWRALAHALRSAGDERRGAVADALVFRAWRHAVSPAAAAEERSLELNEGLAEYTGVRLAGIDAESIARRLETAPSRTATFSRSFAYETGPAYGIRLDAAAGTEWRKSLLGAGGDLALRLGAALGIELPAGDDLRAEAERRLAARGGEALRSAETEREERRRVRLAELTARFVAGPVILVPLTAATRFSFDPGALEALDGVGTVYPTLAMTGEWGTLDVSRGGALIDRDWRFARVPAPAVAAPSRKLEGDGYSLALAEGYRLVPGERPGDLALRRD